MSVIKLNQTQVISQPKKGIGWFDINMDTTMLAGIVVAGFVLLIILMRKN